MTQRDKQREASRLVEFTNSPAVEVALAIGFQQMIFKKSELPVVVPKSTGGLALEWHRASRELAIELSTDGVMVFFCDPGTGEEWERSILDVQPPELVEAFTAIREG